MISDPKVVTSFAKLKPVFFVSMLFKVVSHYDLSVLGNVMMSVIGFQKSFDRGRVGEVSRIQFCFGILFT